MPGTLSNRAPAPSNSGPLTVANKAGPVGQSGTTCGGANQIPCGPAPGVFMGQAGGTCPEGSAFDLISMSCRSCPAGYERTAKGVVEAGTAVGAVAGMGIFTSITAPLSLGISSMIAHQMDTGERACRKRDDSIPQSFAPATFLNRVCPAGSFYHLNTVGGAQCWSCPAGYERTANPIGGPNACARGDDGRRVTAAATLVQEAKCGDDSFRDLKLPGQQDVSSGGGCYTCPSAYRRTANSIDSERACAIPGGFGYASSENIQALFCPAGQFFNPAMVRNKNVQTAIGVRNVQLKEALLPAVVTDNRNVGTCWQCPPGYSPGGAQAGGVASIGAPTCVSNGIVWKSARYQHTGLFGLAGAPAVAEALIKDGALINEIADGLVPRVYASSAAARRATWAKIADGKAASSPVLALAMFSRMTAAATTPAQASADEKAMLESFGQMTRAYKIWLAQEALNAYDAWNSAVTSGRGTAIDRDRASGMQALFNYGTVPPDFEAITATSVMENMVSTVAGEIQGNVIDAVLARTLLNQAVYKKLAPYRMAGRAAQKFTKNKVEELVAKGIAKGTAEAAAKAEFMAMSMEGPQVIIGLAIEVVQASIEQMIEISTARTKLAQKVQYATNAPYNVAQLLQTEAGAGDVENMWNLILSGNTVPGNASQLAADAKVKLASLSGSGPTAAGSSAPAAAAGATPQFDILAGDSNCLRVQGPGAGAPVALAPCQSAGAHRWISLSGALKPDNARCLSDGAQLAATACTPAGQPLPPLLNWTYVQANGQIVNQAGRCLEARGSAVVAATCNTARATQRWSVRQ